MRKVIVDIDGTISKVGDRLKYLKQSPPDWDSFYEACDEDEPIQVVCDIVNKLSKTYEIVFCTGRRESVREKTLDFLVENLWYASNGAFLLMRRDGDFRHDTEVKPELLEQQREILFNSS